MPFNCPEVRVKSSLHDFILSLCLLKDLPIRVRNVFTSGTKGIVGGGFGGLLRSDIW